VKLDDRSERSPGFKFNEWEVKGVPLRIEIGPRDLEKKQITIVRRDSGEKTTMAQKKCSVAEIQSLLDAVQKGLHDQAKSFMEEHTHEADSFEELQKILDGEGGFVWAPWDQTLGSAETIQKKTKASIRLLGDAVQGKKDIVSGNDAQVMALFAKAY